MFFIQSEKLKIIPLSHNLLQLLSNNRASMELSMGLNISDPIIDPFYKKEMDDALINFWLPKTLENRSNYIWYTSWEIILKSENISVGGMGFNGEPNEFGEAEIGYLIYQQFQNKGYATEALRLLSNWALSQNNVKLVKVQTFEDNLPSKRILSKCGFKEVNRNNEGLLTYHLSN